MKSFQICILVIFSRKLDKVKEIILFVIFISDVSHRVGSIAMLKDMITLPAIPCIEYEVKVMIEYKVDIKTFDISHIQYCLCFLFLE